MFQSIPDPEPTSVADVSPLLKAALWLGGAAIVAWLLLFNLNMPNRVPWKVEAGQLQIHARFVWNGGYPACGFRIGNAVVIDFGADPGWLPERKIYGVDASNYHAGNFYLKNGKEAEIYRTTESKAVLLPRSNTVPVLVATDRPEALLSAIRQACPGT